MTFALYVMSALLGLVIGSFLNVVIYRAPRRQSIVRPGSHCPACNAPISWHDNVPVVSWILLRGNCRHCRESISVRYPLVESLTAVLFVLAALVVGLQARLLLAWAFIAVLIVLAFIDLDHLIIPDRIVLPAAGVGLAAAVALDPGRWWHYVVAGLGAGGFLLIVALLSGGGMGMGDVKLSLLLGFVLGVEVIVAMFAAFLLGGIVGIALLALGKRSRKDRIPFGPFLGAGGIIGLFVGTPLMEWYWSLVV